MCVCVCVCVWRDSRGSEGGMPHWKCTYILFVLELSKSDVVITIINTIVKIIPV